MCLEVWPKLKLIGQHIPYTLMTYKPFEVIETEGFNGGNFSLLDLIK